MTTTPEDARKILERTVSDATHIPDDSFQVIVSIGPLRSLLAEYDRLASTLEAVREHSHATTSASENVRKLWAIKGLLDASADSDRSLARVKAEALREAYADIQAYTDAGAPFGHRPVEEFLLRRADRIESEATNA